MATVAQQKKLIEQARLEKAKKKRKVKKRRYK